MFKSFLSQSLLAAVVLLLGAAAAQATAYTIDLTNPAAAQTINSAVFAYDSVSSGSGSYTSLFRIQKDGTESGYNYDGGSTRPFDQKGGVSNTHLDLGEVPIVTIDGVQYMRFNFDANNSAGLTFTDVRLYINSDPTNTNTPVLVNSTANLSNLGTLVYDFNAGGANSLQITAFTSGSGTDDMTINIPLATIYGNANFNASDNVYLWATTSNTDGGFEEFAIDKSLPVTYGGLLPEAKTIWGGASTGLLLIGGLVQRRWKSRRKPATTPAE